jgi:hypothetical protein
MIEAFGQSLRQRLIYDQGYLKILKPLPKS